MSEDFLKNPLSLFDVRGKTAIVTGATGAFGALAAKVLAGAGANVVLAASNAEELKKVAAECDELGGKAEIVAKRPSSEANCDAIVAAAVEQVRRRRYSGRRLRHNKVSKIVDQAPEDFLDVMDANVTQSWLMARAAGAADARAGPRRQDRADVVGARPARPSGRLHRLLRLEVGGRRHHQGARLRMGRDRHHRQCDRADGVPLAAHRMDVRGRRARQRRCARAFSPACRRAASASRPISPGRCCSSPRRRPTSTPATSSTPTAATRRADTWRRKRAHCRRRRRPDGARHRAGFRARRP